MRFFSLRSRTKRARTLWWVLVGVVLATLISVIAVFIGYRRIAADPDEVAAILNQLPADITLNGIRHTATRDGKDEWTLTADSASVLRDRKKTVIEKPSVTFFLDDGGKAYLKADKGILKTESNDLEVMGEVTVKTKDYTLRTERLRYDHHKQALYTRGPVLIEGKRVSLSAEGMYYDLKTRASTFKGNVEGTLHEKILL